MTSEKMMEPAAHSQSKQFWLRSRLFYDCFGAHWQIFYACEPTNFICALSRSRLGSAIVRKLLSI